MTGDADSLAIVADGPWTGDVDEEEGVVVNWFAAEGSSVKSGETVCEIQIEKVSVDIPAPADGTIVDIVRSENNAFTIGDTLANMEVESNDGA